MILMTKFSARLPIRIISHGRAIIPNLENLWENSPDEDVQERIELIIHKLHFRDLVEEFTNWKNGSCELLQGALFVGRNIVIPK